ncbi:MAG TPA: PIG-L family deacetylase, partial [Patescibacteria group bacterium]|nr:PIG-L family deacetylase [Patescibacteria group bacterium]
MLDYKAVFAEKEKVLFVTAHPDDVDVFFGGLICLLRKEGKQVKVVVVTNGARGSRDNNIPEAELAKKRIAEEEGALSCLGLEKENFLTLNYLDGEVENSFELIGDIARVIREFKPEICCTHEPNGIYY